MQISTHSNRDSSSCEETHSSPQPFCPLCGETLVPLRNVFRCVQCSYSLCVGCESGEWLSTAPTS